MVGVSSFAPGTTTVPEPKNPTPAVALEVINLEGCSSEAHVQSKPTSPSVCPTLGLLSMGTDHEVGSPLSYHPQAELILSC